MTDTPKVKTRVKTHIMEDVSADFLRALLPDEWVVRDYRPDYGLDLTVELFEPMDKDGKAPTLGEHLFMQLKSVQVGDYATRQVPARRNIELEPELPDPAESISFDVIKFSIDVPMLNTVEKMGSGVPVLLVLVDLDSARTFFVCLNDYIDKCLAPSNPDFRKQGHCTLYLPTTNELNMDPATHLPLKWYAKRAKLYGGFIKLAYQANHLWGLEIGPGATPRLLARSKRFFDLLATMDFWSAQEMWPAMRGEPESLWDSILALAETWKTSGEGDITDAAAMGLVHHWKRLDALSRIHEEVCRELYLPTYLWSVVR